MARLIKENRMADNTIFIPAAEFAARNKAYFPNESPEYRQARNALLTEEIELRRARISSYLGGRIRVQWNAASVSIPFHCNQHSPFRALR
jgi:hypothetical protein